MSYAISVDPASIAAGESATVEVTLPEVEDVVHELDLVRRNTSQVVASAQVTVHAEQLTVGTVTDESTDYYVDAGGLELVQTGPTQFEVNA